MHIWLQTPAGQQVLAWESERFDATVADMFGYHALQLGLGGIQSLRSNRMPHRWLALDDPTSAAGSFATDFTALPFEDGSLDLIVMPHALEFCTEPHAALREVERVLVPEGRLVLSGFNPASLWGLRQGRQRLLRRMGVGMGGLFLPERGDFIAYRRLRDWLRLLSFEVTASQFGIYSPAMRSQAGLDRMAWLEGVGGRFWHVFGAVYLVVAVKRVRGMRLLRAPTRKPVFATAPVSVANKAHHAWTIDPDSSEK